MENITPDPSMQVMGALSVLSALLEQETGQQISPMRTGRIEAALKPLMRDRRIASLDDLATVIVTGADRELETLAVEAMLNQETSFFRDAAVMDQAIDVLLTLMADAGERRLRVWCAGCSTGQEPYSLAILLSERLANSDKPFPDIIATDVSACALNRARQGRYSSFEIQRGMPVRRMVSWFDTEGESWVARPELRKRIRYLHCNLVADMPPAGPFDLILCRNVLFYFALPIRRRIFEMIAGNMRPEALLLLGAGETVIGQTQRLQPSPRFRGFYSLMANA
ncbi:CheR family methyltransferase [Stakelama sediminis]|nr:CheR family methyltransferase [Stakelama sediminis]